MTEVSGGGGKNIGLYKHSFLRGSCDWLVRKLEVAKLMGENTWCEITEV